jgi:hypothetical protein
MNGRTNAGASSGLRQPGVTGAPLSLQALSGHEDGFVFIDDELNTMPGFTAHPMYPKVWPAVGIPYADLVQGLIELALVCQAGSQQRPTAEVGQVSLAHFDADPYSSTACALEWITPLLHGGSLLLFDEFFGEDPVAVAFGPRVTAITCLWSSYRARDGHAG